MKYIAFSIISLSLLSVTASIFYKIGMNKGIQRGRIKSYQAITNCLDQPDKYSFAICMVNDI